MRRTLYHKPIENLVIFWYEKKHLSQFSQQLERISKDVTELEKNFLNGNVGKNARKNKLTPRCCSE